MRSELSGSGKIGNMSKKNVKTAVLSKLRKRKCDFVMQKCLLLNVRESPTASMLTENEKSKTSSIEPLYEGKSFLDK